MMALVKYGAIAAVVVKLVGDYREFDRAARPWRPLIRASADRHGVSEHVLAAILYQESRFDPTAEGSAGEVGMCQFMPIAAQDLNIDFGDLADNPKLQIDAAAELLALNMQRSDQDLWTAVRAYNVGIGRARSNNLAGVSYAIDVFRVALAGWIYTSLGGASLG